MPLLDDTGFVQVDNSEDIWNIIADNDSDLDECNFLGFRTSTTAAELDSEVNSGKERRVSIKNGAPLAQVQRKKRRRRRNTLLKKKPTNNGTRVAEVTDNIEVPHCPREKLEEEAALDGPNNNEKKEAGQTTPNKRRKRRSTSSLEKSPTKERPGTNGGWEVCLRQRTQVFHYYQTNERRRRTKQDQTPVEDKGEATKSGNNGLEVNEPLTNDQINPAKASLNSELPVPAKLAIIDVKTNLSEDNLEENKINSVEALSDSVLKPTVLTTVDVGSESDSVHMDFTEDMSQDAKMEENVKINETSKEASSEEKDEILNEESVNCDMISDEETIPEPVPSEIKTPTINDEKVTPRSRPVRKSKKKLKRFLVAERCNTPDGIWMSISRSPSPVGPIEIAEPNDNANGVIVWAKLAKYPWWPAIIMDGEDCSRERAGEGTQWIFWLGDHKISKLATNQMVEFVTNFKNKYNERGSKQYFRSVNEALTVCASRCGVNISSDQPQELIQWAKEGFYNSSSKGFPFIPNPLDPIPEFIRRRQEKIRTTGLGDKFICDSTTNSPIALSGRDRIPSAIAKVKAGQLSITEMCLACDSVHARVVAMHPLFHGGLCKECKEELRETLYAIGEDGTSSYCAVCGSPGELIICDHPGCSKVYCSSCIKLYAAEGQLDVVVQASPWYCYFCLEFDQQVHGYLRKASNWEMNIIQLFHTDSQVNIFPDQSFTKKRPIRVLSLFDGIGTGRLVLDQLNIEVEVYYSSEIDSDSILVASVRHKVTQLGNVESLSDADVARLCPFDLLIGGSPCNDLSLVNPIRKGLYDPTGTGKLFFDFFRILRAIQLNNQNNHLFWLFENVASMPHEYRGIISRFLQCEPSMIDSKYFSPQNRARYYWGNIPGLYSSIPAHYVEQEIPLQSIITPGCNRKAVVDKVRCITTRSNSLVQKGGAYPVDMDGKPDSLWINELEKAFGFPEHHTDIGNLSFNRRQHLLGRAWTVPVIEYILKPLKNFFKVKNEQPTQNQTPTSHRAAPTLVPSSGGCWSPPSSSSKE